MIHLDTHVVAWLYAGRDESLPLPARERLNRDVPRISPMVLLELDYLREIGRFTVSGQDTFADLESRIGLRLSTAPFLHVVRMASPLSFTRDPFDRLIVANAMADGCELLTADRRILDHCKMARWGDPHVSPP